MRYVGSIAVSALLLLAVAASGTPVALATSTDNPRWSLCVASETGKFAAGCETVGTTFEVKTPSESESKEVKALAAGTQLLPIAAGKVVAKKLKFATKASILGSNLPNPGTGRETIEFEELSLQGDAECKLDQNGTSATTLKTKPLKNRLAYGTKTAAESEKGATDNVLEPVSGTTFLEYELVGANCAAAGEHELSGSIALESVEAAKFKETHEYKNAASDIYFIDESGKPVEKTAEIKEGGTKVVPVILFGLAVVGVLAFASLAM